jgi:RNA polymerase sigma-70 factor (ECF subfamily)
MDTTPTGGGATSPSDRGQRELLERFVHAFINEDTAALVALMTDDVWVRMPPLPFEYHGHEAAHRFFTAVDAHRHAIARMQPVAVNGQAAWGEYVRDPHTALLHLAGVLVVATADNRTARSPTSRPRSRPTWACHALSSKPRIPRESARCQPATPMPPAG